MLSVCGYVFVLLVVNVKFEVILSSVFYQLCSRIVTNCKDIKKNAKVFEKCAVIHVTKEK